MGAIKVNYNQKVSAEIQIYRNTPCIYKITSPTGRVYIGQTINILLRLGKYRSCNVEQYKIHCSIVKFGWDAHTVEVLCSCQKHEMDELEIKYIKEYDSYNSGLNSTEGGRNAKLTAYQKDRVRRSNQTRAIKSETIAKRKATCEKTGYPMQGKKHSEESKLKMSLSRIGKKKTEEQMVVFRKAHEKRRGIKRPQWVVDKIRETHLKRREVYKYKDPSLQYHPLLHIKRILVNNEDLNIKVILNSQREAANLAHLSGTTVTQLIRGDYDHPYKGYTMKNVVLYY